MVVRRKRGNKDSWQEDLLTHTIDGDGDGLGQSEAIGTLESRDLAEGRELAVLSTGVERGSVVSLSLDQLQVQVVVLGSDQDGEGATVVLEEVREGTMTQLEEEPRTGRP